MSSQRSDGQYISYEDEDMDIYPSLWLVESLVDLTGPQCMVLLRCIASMLSMMYSHRHFRSGPSKDPSVWLFMLLMSCRMVPSTSVTMSLSFYAMDVVITSLFLIGPFK